MPFASDHLVLTGATGFIGSHLVVRMLSEPAVQLTLLVRGKNADQARERVLERIRIAAREAATPFDELHARPRIHVLVGDVTLPCCGVSRDELERARSRGSVEFWHAAASLDFDEVRRERIEEHNVDGVRHALELAEALGAQRFVHISTAYVAGSAEGSVPEQLFSNDRQFNNAYERSKCIGEGIVHEHSSARGLEHHILRPSIVIGDSRSYSPAGSDSGLYGFLREMWRIRRALAACARPPRLVADGDAPLNFIPIDQLVDDMLALREAGFPGGPVHHLTGRRCPTVAESLNTICDALELARFRLVPELSGEISLLEGLLSRRMTFYASYLRGTRVFERALGTPFDMGASELERYVKGYLTPRSDRGEPLQESLLGARDGFPLQTASPVHPSRQAVVLVNALGMPRAALDKLEHALSAQYDVFTWESRGAPSLAGDLGGSRAEFARHGDDLEDLLARHGVGPVHVVGWCSGSDVALDFTLRDPSRVRGLVCLQGPFVGASSFRTPYQTDLERIVRRAARSEAHAALFHGLIAEALARPSAESIGASEPQESVRRALSALEPEFAHVTSAPLQSVASFHRYCVLLRHYFDEAPRDLPALGAKTLIVSTDDDAIAHVAASREVAERLGATLRVFASGGHFAPCRDDAVIATVTAFLSESSAARAPQRAARLNTANGPMRPSDQAA